MGGGIGIVRVSGVDAVAIVERIFRPKTKGKKLSEQKTYTIHYGEISDFEGSVIDEVLVLLMRAPHSYTAEDVVEIDCHAGSFVVQSIMELLRLSGARPAEPGEFTKRAFLNGRIDLSQAESVMDIIQSKNRFALDSSIKQLHGAVKSKIISLRERILHESAFIESAIDDPEHYDLDGYRDILLSVVQSLLNELRQLLKASDDGRILSEGLNTVIVGKPNAGKSSLMNYMLGNDYAIVTDVAGTTRDLLEKDLMLDGIVLHITDTAGIRDSLDEIELIGVERAKNAMLEADLILYVVDASVPMDENDDKIINMIHGRKAIALLNKSDLPSAFSSDSLQDMLNIPILKCSAKTGEGLSDLSGLIKNMFLSGGISYNDEVYITNIRQRDCLQRALDSLMIVKSGIESGVPEDFYTADLLNAYESLGLIIGESVSDDLVDRIFSEFCMGK